MSEPNERDAADAAQAIERFWAALANDDAVELLRVTARTLQEAVGIEPGNCERLRDLLGISARECRLVGTSSKVRVVPGGHMVFICMKVADGATKVLGSWGPEQIVAWGLMVEAEDGMWRISGQYHGEQWPPGTRYLDLPWAPPTGPTH